MMVKLSAEFRSLWSISPPSMANRCRHFSLGFDGSKANLSISSSEHRLQLPPPQLFFDQTLMRSTVFYSSQEPFPQLCYYVHFTDNSYCFEPPAMPFYPLIYSSFGNLDVPYHFVEKHGEFHVHAESFEGEGDTVRNSGGQSEDFKGNELFPSGPFSCGQRGRRWWQPVQKKPGRVAVRGEFEFKDDEGCAVEGEKTTVMLRNLANKLRKEQLLALLDEHCRDENRKLRACTEAVFSEFDFFYLPIDFATGNNLGYAFVNFTSSRGATRFYRSFHHKYWASFSSRKICEVSYARFQHFNEKKFACDNKDYLPVRFCNGFNPTVEEQVARLSSDESRTVNMR